MSDLNSCCEAKMTEREERGAEVRSEGAAEVRSVESKVYFFVSS